MKLTPEILRQIISEEVEAANQAAAKMTKGDLERLRSKKSPSMGRGTPPRLRKSQPAAENSRDDYGTERIGSVRFYVENGELLAAWNLGELGTGNDSAADWKDIVMENCEAMIDAAKRYYSDILDED